MLKPKSGFWFFIGREAQHAIAVDVRIFAQHIDVAMVLVVVALVPEKRTDAYHFEGVGEQFVHPSFVRNGMVTGVVRNVEGNKQMG